MIGVLLLAVMLFPVYWMANVSLQPSGSAAQTPLYSAYNNLGLLNSIPGLILADSTAGIPFAILILRAFLGAIPTEVVEAAKVDAPARSGPSCPSCCR